MTQLHPHYVVDSEGKRRSVLLPIEEFEELLECVQDVFDAEEIERVKDEPRFPWEEVVEERAKLDAQ